MMLNEPAALPPSRAVEPTRAGERLAAIDVVRGFALFGILMVNLQYWFRTTVDRYGLDPHPWPGLGNTIVDFAVPLLFDGKFISLFSMLFGIGLALQMERVEARGAGFGRFALRRLGALFLLGVAHITLLWWGDILHVYALNGLLLLLFLRRKTRTIVAWASCIMGLPIVVCSIQAIVFFVRSKAPAPVDLGLLQAAVDRTVRTYRDGSWLEIARFRLGDYLKEAPSMANTIPFAFSGFLTGLAAWKAGIVQRPSEHLPTLRKALAFGLLFGLAVEAVRLVLDSLPPERTMWQRRLVWGLIPSSTLAQAVAYGSGILLLLQKEPWRDRLAVVACAGRMALTNYLLQSLLCSFVFYGFGLRLYDRLAPAAGVLVVLGIYVLELLLSRWWLGRYRFGPVEWLWRSMTYGEPQPMRLDPVER